jgi:phenylacetate-CoA ligase
MSPANLGAYVDELRSKCPPYLHGYPSVLALLAAYVLESGISLGYEVKWVTTTSESLLPQQANLIERAFGVRPRQWYGMTEMVAGVAECEYGRLHIDEDYAAVEFIPNPNGPGHKVIGTSFVSVAVPLLRYDVGDLVTPATDACSCGRPGRVLASIDGRKEDYVILKNGARLGRMDHIFKDMVNIHEAQIYQKYPGEITIRVVCGRNYTDADEATLLQQVRKRIGDDADTQIKYVESIERSSNGKLRFVVSEIQEGQLESPRL